MLGVRGLQRVRAASQDEVDLLRYELHDLTTYSLVSYSDGMSRA